MQKSVDFFYFPWLTILWLDVFIFIFTQAYNHEVKFKNGSLITYTSFSSFLSFFFPLVKIFLKRLSGKIAVFQAVKCFQVWMDADL